LLYGAYGYTGRLTAELAASQRRNIVLAGRNEGALAALGERLGLPIRAVALDDADKLADALQDIACVMHMAGPFTTTSTPMLNACLATRTSYVDITGEIEVFEALWSRKDEIERVGITVIPGAGFGAHIEMTTKPGELIPDEAPSHPDEHVLEISYANLPELQTALHAMGDNLVQEAHRDFVIFPKPAREQQPFAPPTK
jgi:nucleoside-diphosphate-sugar epimerase